MGARCTSRSPRRTSSNYAIVNVQVKPNANREFQELCPDVSAETIRRDLADMVSKNILLKIGEKRATYYIFK